MAKVKAFDPNTFEEKEIEFDDFHIELGDQIKTALEVLEPTPLLYAGNQICIGIFNPALSKRRTGEPLAHNKYRIIIEKVIQ